MIGEIQSEKMQNNSTPFSAWNFCVRSQDKRLGMGTIILYPCFIHSFKNLWFIGCGLGDPHFCQSIGIYIYLGI